MSEQFKAYVNRAAFATNDNETQVTLYIERPSMDSEGKINIVREELGLLIFSHSYAKIFRDALDQNLKTYTENKEKAQEKIDSEVK